MKSNINIFKVFIRVLIIIIFVAMEYVLTYWNTDPILIGKSDYINESEDRIFLFKGFKYDGELPTVGSLDQFEDMEEYTAFFMNDVVFEPTGYYMLLDSKNEGTVRKGKTHNIMPRDYFTTRDILIRLYRGMYGQFYVVTLQDQSKVLALLNCNADKALENGDYKKIVAVKQTVIPISYKVDKDDETFKHILELNDSMDASGYIDMSDSTWSSRHSFGVFWLDVLKAIISCAVALVVLLVLSKITGKEIE